jgi:ribosomal protein S18 acetylase RimI-like enzyme
LAFDIGDILFYFYIDDSLGDRKELEMCRDTSRTELGDVTRHNIKQLKRLNQVVFPVSYNDKFYKDVLEVGDLAKLAFYNDIVVGAVCCRVQDGKDGGVPDKGAKGAGAGKKLYIMTLGCLAHYRRLGIEEGYVGTMFTVLTLRKRTFAVPNCNPFIFFFYTRNRNEVVGACFEHLQKRWRIRKCLSPCSGQQL